MKIPGTSPEERLRKKFSRDRAKIAARVAARFEARNATDPSLGARGYVEAGNGSCRVSEDQRGQGVDRARSLDRQEQSSLARGDRTCSVGEALNRFVSRSPDTAANCAQPWESVKDGGAVELGSYLERYPDGTFSSLARTRQHLIDRKVPDVHLKSNVGPDTMPDALDLAFWNAIKESQRPEEFVAYLERHPDGHFATLARARLS